MTTTSPFPRISCLLLGVLFLFSNNSNIIVNAAVLGKSRHENPDERTIVIHNRSGRRMEVSWINKSKDPWEFMPNSDKGEGYKFGADAPIKSYVGHEFLLLELPSKKTKSCLIADACRKAYIQVNKEEDQEVILDQEWQAVHTDRKTKAQQEAKELLEKCKTSVTESNLNPLDKIEALTTCMENQVDETLQTLQEEQEFHASPRQNMATSLVPYACSDTNYTASQEVYNRTWNYQQPNAVLKSFEKFQVRVLHERSTASSTFKIHDFASVEECQALKFFQTKDDGDGEKSFVPFMAVNGKSKQGSLVHGLATRYYELARASLQWPDLSFGDMKRLGHELLDVRKDANPVKVPTHKCNKGETHSKEDGNVCRLPGDEPVALPTFPTIASQQQDSNNNSVIMATMFLFCSKPNQLGGLHFPQAGIHLNPLQGMLVFVVHRREVDQPADAYVDEYHLCPNHDLYTTSFFKTVPKEQQQQEEQKTTTTTAPSSVQNNNKMKEMPTNNAQRQREQQQESENLTVAYSLVVLLHRLKLMMRGANFAEIWYSPTGN